MAKRHWQIIKRGKQFDIWENMNTGTRISLKAKKKK